MIDAVILAAGQSSRMGTDKALLPIGKTNFIHRIINEIQSITTNIFIVLGSNFDTVKKDLEDVESNYRLVKNAQHHLGMFSSVQAGLRATDRKNPVLLHMIDQPLIPSHIYRKLVDSLSDKVFIVQPSYKKKAGHPLLIAPDFIEIILSYNVQDNLKKVIDDYKHKRKFVNVNNKTVLDNINTRSKYKEKI